MTITNCPNCGGNHYGSVKCPYISAPCVICGVKTILACSDCAVGAGGKKSVHVCGKNECRNTHERMHPAKQPWTSDQERETAIRQMSATSDMRCLLRLLDAEREHVKALEAALEQINNLIGAAAIGHANLTLERIFEIVRAVLATREEGKS